MIAIIDSGIANIASVLGACQRVGAEAEVTSDPRQVARARALILPGVGAFADGMESLSRRGLIQPILAAAAAGTPILGICLGMQLLADASEEFGTHPGLGLVPGRVCLLRPALRVERVPNIGWCDVLPGAQSHLFAGVARGTPFYFVHSYHFVCAEAADCAGTIRFGGGAVCAAVERGNVWGAQFHPEKSQDAGLEVLGNFMRHAQAQAAGGN